MPYYSFFGRTPRTAMNKKQKETKAWKNIRLGFIDIFSKGKPIIRTRWFSIWFVRK